MSYFSSLQGKPRISKFAVFDIESSKWTHFEGLGFYDGKKYRHFESVHTFLKEVMRPKYKGYVIFAHAGARFDFNFLFMELQANYKAWKITAPSSEAGVWFIKCSKMRGKKSGRKNESWCNITFSDSFRLIPLSLAQAGKTFDVEHKKIELPITKTVRHDKKGYHHFRSSMEDVTKFKNWKEYLQFDCLCLYECVQAFYSMIVSMGGSCMLTMASSAMDLYRRHFMPKGILIPPTDSPRMNAFLRAAYYGGMTEVYEFEIKDGHKFDKNSMYPWVMRYWTMPIGMPFWMSDINAIGFSQAQVIVPKTEKYPLLPVRWDGKLIRPTGNIEGVWDNYYLQRAQELGYKVKVLRTLAFSSEGYIFDEWVDFWYAKKKKGRETGDKGMEFIAKQMLNSLYGKFGQRREQGQFLFSPKNTEGMTPYDDDNEIWIKPVQSRATYIRVAIAAHITSVASVELHRDGANHGMVYCDTDSIVTRERMTTGLDLGDMKEEHEVVHGLYYLPKLYAERIRKNGEVKTEIKAKGFSKDLREHLEENFEEIQRIGTKAFREKGSRFLTMKASIRQSGQYLSKRIVSRSVKSDNTKRVRVGMSTAPIHLEMFKGLL
jgi:hypothetical protein